MGVWEELEVLEILENSLAPQAKCMNAITRHRPQFQGLELPTTPEAQGVAMEIKLYLTISGGAQCEKIRMFVAEYPCIQFIKAKTCSFLALTLDIP